MSENSRKLRVKVLYYAGCLTDQMLREYDLVLIQSGVVTGPAPYGGAEWGLVPAYLKEGALLPDETIVIAQDPVLLQTLVQHLVSRVKESQYYSAGSSFSVFMKAEELAGFTSPAFTLELH
ncbi:MAG: hypothetical protein A3B74_03570 [Candidatus Kerfeldbacteria bacterium RIFCSPHIGHO2_02_FULL_42_14]|uniref:Uncharacterized protein n=1 Tax=Candidatus Kerfeldbacteria bacterium RIFCSPHIGHO2_02_FULL_42_14 TaxID=1798540 RepID=A0A1G2APW7_9BACT|nr:MAG: hypothetical protein A3B74_03570 [Candidatus Kerfeldbacteria bacterium RIFCSPHIGHO2_02_FULL_42_14]OGY80596.1 MAG: hypothetical protein A3E60_04065 [Candidatus Kerfeldbacteria bacterium RIFCSPHIGHO2_12_FULL_42_13]OGY82520.1 MAG: hypothetical protein A3I91_03730 [Candidatus Kerfeldbacteria bacterium RIFCSPLOWO2_02_FULL_42_19]OGY87558.1 MAG: hypothetical protein A3G01_00870 [Candidatus Kerfeldbacteria bacterium RIFCSPLOWO2_12_FULL_43_9]